MRWSYIVRQRRRWLDQEASRQRQTERLQRELRRLGVGTRDLRKLHGLVEVSVPCSDDDAYWEARILPWEYVLAAATQPYREGKPFLVVRHLRTGRRSSRREPTSFAVVETAPGALAGEFDFSAQRALVADGLRQLGGDHHQTIKNPTAAQLKAVLKTSSPDVVHVSGVDIHTSRRLLNRQSTGSRDGLVLADSMGGPQECRAEQVAMLLNSGRPAPLLVGFYAWNSGARMAPMAVAQGAKSAIGFQHTFDEEVAEVFFHTFYRTFQRSAGNLLAAFHEGWDAVANDRDRIRGSSLILWSAESLVTARSIQSYQAWQERDQSRPVRRTLQRTADPTRDQLSELVYVTVRPKTHLNYSSLHNGENLFNELTFRLEPSKLNQDCVNEQNGTLKEQITTINDIEIEVRLHAGEQSFPYRSRLTLSTDQYWHDIADRITLPLTGALFSAIEERIATGLYVGIRWHDQVIHRETYRVWLSPMDQWTLEDRQLAWLPSFVHPRDPAVSQTVTRALKYLQCMADRMDVGFDGYQCYDGSTSGAKQWDGVDDQTRAIWSALMIDSNLAYINPPPSYAPFTQRLRSPGETIEGGFGTCVDLAIALVSCLEWIDLYPVLFLLHGHVFAGYWRDPCKHRDFMDVLANDYASHGDQGVSSDEPAPRRWVSDEKTYGEIKSFVDRGELVPIETVALTERKGFEDAIDAGRDHFYKTRSRAFRAMIDLVSARNGNAVTPLPLSRYSSHSS